MNWIVLGEKDGKIRLVSKKDTDAILPKGSYLTADVGTSKFILRIDESRQTEPYSPTPLIVDMDLAGLDADARCKNEIIAFRVCDVNEREDGMVDFIPPLTVARRSTQQEIDIALGMNTKGPKVFLATVHSNQNRV